MASTVQTALRKLLPSKLPPSLSPHPGSLYEVLSRYPQDGVGQRVYQTRWGAKGIEGSYWEVTRTKLKAEGQHGKAWGVLVWKGEHQLHQTTFRKKNTFLHDFIHRQACRRGRRTNPWRTQVQMGCRRVPNEAGFQAPTPVYIMILHRSSFCTHSMSPNHHALARFSKHPYDSV